MTRYVLLKGAHADQAPIDQLCGDEPLWVSWGKEVGCFFRAPENGIALQCDSGVDLHEAWLVMLAPGVDDPLSEWCEAARAIGLKCAIAWPQDLPDATVRINMARMVADLVMLWPTGAGAPPPLDDAGQGGAQIVTAQTLQAGLGAWRPLRRLWCYLEGTAATPYNSGIQRLARATCRALQDLGVEVVALGWDESAQDFRALSDGEAAHLARWDGPSPRAGRHTWPERGDWILVPEIMLPPGPSAEAILRAARRRGARTAFVFFDLIPLKLSPLAEHRAAPIYAAGVARQYQAYWRQIAHADAIVPISFAAADDYEGFLRSTTEKQAGLDCRLRPIQLGGDLAQAARVGYAPPAQSGVFTIVSVGTVEPRKNHARLIRGFAAAAAHAQSPPMRLVIIGSHLPHPDYARDIEILAGQVATDKAAITLVKNADDKDLRAWYAACDLVAYASCEEGFGLPILESAWFGAPCLCHNEGAIAETAQGGGSRMIDMLDEAAIAAAIAALTGDREALDALRQEACARPIKTWRSYAADLCAALDAVAPRPVPAPSASPPQNPPLLSICVTTYNRAGWLGCTLPRLLALTAPYRDLIEVVVCDNASSDATPEVIANNANAHAFRALRTATNVGMLGNLGVCARQARGAYVWLLGDDDILVAGVIEDILEALLTHPQAEMLYLNYAHSRLPHAPAPLEVDAVVSRATAAARSGPSQGVAQLREIALHSENLFTAIYACVFRRPHALGAYVRAYDEAPFSSLAASAPSASYALRHLLDRPAVWIGQPGVVVDLNVSWMEHALAWRLLLLPDLFDWAEREGLGGARLDSYRWQQARDAPDLVAALYGGEDAALRARFDIARYAARHIHMPAFRAITLPKLRSHYKAAANAGRLPPGAITPHAFARLFQDKGR